MTTITNNKRTSVKLAQFIIVAFVFSLAAYSGLAQRRERVVDSWRPLHYDVNLTFDDQLSQLSAARTDIRVEVLAPTINKVDFDFGDLPVDSVLVAGAAAKFERVAERLDVLLATAAQRGNKLDITVNYHGRPKDGLVFAKDADGKPSATGDNWPNRVHYWIPSLDHPSAKATVSFNIAAPQRFQVTANGEFVRLIGNAAVSHWTYNENKPIPPYCMIVAINEGVIINSPDKDVTNLLYNVPQRDAEYAPKGFSPAAPALTFYSQTVAPYPYEKLALIIGATQFGGMENSSAIVFPSNVFGQRSEVSAPLGRSNAVSRRFGIPSRIESVVAHEIAHQWFGDSVTESTWADLWLSEGFATYFAGLFIEKYDGEDAFHVYMRGAAQRYFNFEKQASFPIHDTETPKLMSLLNPNNYEKGAWVLHMLRMQLGGEVFFKGLRDYYNAHKEANASTEDLRSALEKASGKDLKAFFARWVYGSGHPVYRVETARFGSGPNMMSHIDLRQVQTGDAFLDPVTVEFTTMDGKKQRQTITPKSKLESVQIGVNLQVKDIQIDPDDNLLKEVVK